MWSPLIDSTIYPEFDTLDALHIFDDSYEDLDSITQHAKQGGLFDWIN